ncbi:hypothetical protein P7K49_015104 [Saguinus oedipus]|uniref:Uncharacterized protein n=1 Tax=Saguinus oedipus TaxID=9490 RepID=A0ABQ9V8B1_SAGOE|nr:hypothetical protein P7K49_015104 [Saguinus oedipus]
MKQVLVSGQRPTRLGPPGPRGPPHLGPPPQEAETTAPRVGGAAAEPAGATPARLGPSARPSASPSRHPEALGAPPPRESPPRPRLPPSPSSPGSARALGPASPEGPGGEETPDPARSPRNPPR